MKYRVFSDDERCTIGITGVENPWFIRGMSGHILHLVDNFYDENYPPIHKEDYVFLVDGYTSYNDEMQNYFTLELFPLFEKNTSIANK